ncbi:MAG: hypothetical protein QFF03_22380, partial [Pseudomonadota bacterium]|nr:hypothetical protein [Pseudomonadota bacterium]
RDLAPLATREGNTLALTLAGKATLRLHTLDRCAGRDDCSIYRLLGLSPDRQFFAVERTGYEAATRFWIARASGKQTEVYAEPHAAPDRAHIVTANPVELGGTNGVFLWEIRGDELIEQFRLEPAAYALYHFVRWSNATTVELSKLTHADPTICPASQVMASPVRLARQHGQWRLDERAPPAMPICQ